MYNQYLQTNPYINTCSGMSSKSGASSYLTRLLKGWARGEEGGEIVIGLDSQRHLKYTMGPSVRPCLQEP
jgi:hypothetical protein